MKVQLTNIDEIKPYPNNPRKLSKKAIDKVAMSLKEYGFQQPIVVDKDKIIVVGHTRYQASKTLGYKEVPVLIADQLSPEKINAYRIADNRTNEEAEWDYDLLETEIKELHDKDFDLNLTGMDDKELNKILFEEKQGETDDDAIPEAPEEPVAKIGDIWTLGKHKLICGDSTKEETSKKLFNDNKADMIFTDPPYNVNYGGTDHPSWKKRSIQNDNMSDDEFETFLENFLLSAQKITKQGSPVYICFGERNSLQVLKAFNTAGLHHSCNIIWKKDSLVLGRSDYHYIHEPIFYGWFKGQQHIYYGDRKQTSVWEFDRPKRSELHPTMKPVELVVKAVKNSSKEEDIVYEPFGGSGSTIIACEKLNRSCYTIELDPKFCDVIIKRWEEWTGNKAVLENGQK
jgi:DNA modification methylase